MIYSDWITYVCNVLEYTVTDATSATPTDNDAFNAMIPASIDYAENRLQRDLDFLQTTVTIATGTMTPNSRTLTYPSTDLPAVSQIPALLGTPVPANTVVSTTINTPNVNVAWTAHGRSVGDDVSFLTPNTVGGITLGGVYQVLTVPNANNLTIAALNNATSTASRVIVGNGIFVVASQIRPIVGGIAQQPLEPVTRSYLDYVWPSDVSPGAGILPVQWCPKDQTTALVGPAPDQAYGFEVVGTMRIPKLSSTNYTNFLTEQFPDMYVAASLVFLFGYQRDFGGQADDPQTAQSWENQYKTLLASAQIEESRKKFMNMAPSPSKPTGLTSQAPGG